MSISDCEGSNGICGECSIQTKRHSGKQLLKWNKHPRKLPIRLPLLRAAKELRHYWRILGHLAFVCSCIPSYGHAHQVSQLSEGCNGPWQRNPNAMASFVHLNVLRDCHSRLIYNCIMYWLLPITTRQSSATPFVQFSVSRPSLKSSITVCRVSTLSLYIVQLTYI